MTLKQLLQRNFWESVSPIISTLDFVEEKDMEKYKIAFEKLTILFPEETDMTIVVKHDIDDFENEEYVDVFGMYNHPKDRKEKRPQDIESIPWEKCLGMGISDESLKEFSEPEIIAYCLYDMTLLGYSQEEIQEWMDQTRKTLEEQERITGEPIFGQPTIDDLIDDLLYGDDSENE